MATGYVRQSAADIVSGEVVRAAPLNNEFNALRDAFAATTGHNHDNTTGGGAYVGTLADVDANNKIVVDTGNNRFGVFVEVSAAPVEQVRFADGSFTPVTTNDVDIGSTSARFKDGWFAGNLTTANATIATANVTTLVPTNITGTVNLSGAVMTNVVTPTNAGDITSKGYVDGLIASIIGGNPVPTDINMSGFKVVNMGTPTSGTDATTKNYVDASDTALQNLTYYFNSII